MPSRDHYLVVAAETRVYFEGYMRGRYLNSRTATLERFETTMTTSHFEFGDPVSIVYESTAYFATASTTIPMTSVVEDVLEEAFDDPTMYLNILRSLPQSNPFSETTSFMFVDPPVTTDGTGVNGGEANDPEIPAASARSGRPLGLAAGAVGGILLVAGFMLYKRTSSSEEEDYAFSQKSFNKPPPPSGEVTVAGDTFMADMTVAGDTYTGETVADTYDGTASISKDDDKGMVNVDLETSEQNDTLSLAAAWNGTAEDVSDEFGNGKDDEDIEDVPDDELISEPDVDEVFQPFQQEQDDIDPDVTFNSLRDDLDEMMDLMDDAKEPSEINIEKRKPDEIVRSLDDYDALARPGSLHTPDGSTHTESTGYIFNEEGMHGIAREEDGNRPLSVEEIESLLNL